MLTTLGAAMTAQQDFVPTYDMTFIQLMLFGIQQQHAGCVQPMLRDLVLLSIAHGASCRQYASSLATLTEAGGAAPGHTPGSAQPGPS